MVRQIAVLGATGSIGASTLDVIQRHPDRYRAAVLAANRSVDEMERLCRLHVPGHAVMGDPDAASALAGRLKDLTSTEVVSGPAVLDQLVSAPAVDTVVAGIVGFAGLRPTLSAAGAGKTILLANKEALVSAGGLFMDAVSAAVPRCSRSIVSTMPCISACRLTRAGALIWRTLRRLS